MASSEGCSSEEGASEACSSEGSFSDAGASEVCPAEEAGVSASLCAPPLSSGEAAGPELSETADVFSPSPAEEETSSAWAGMSQKRQAVMTKASSKAVRRFFLIFMRPYLLVNSTGSFLSGICGFSAGILFVIFMISNQMFSASAPPELYP